MSAGTSRMRQDRVLNIELYRITQTISLPWSAQRNHALPWPRPVAPHATRSPSTRTLPCFNTVFITRDGYIYVNDGRIYIPYYFGAVSKSGARYRTHPEISLEGRTCTYYTSNQDVRYSERIFYAIAMSSVIFSLTKIELLKL